MTTEALMTEPVGLPLLDNLPQFFNDAADLEFSDEQENATDRTDETPTMASNMYTAMATGQGQDLPRYIPELAEWVPSLRNDSTASSESLPMEQHLEPCIKVINETDTVDSKTTVLQMASKAKNRGTGKPAAAESGRTKRRRTKKTEQIPEPEPEDNRRDKFLERNRLAASKCRQKKKQWVTELQDTKTELENQHAKLQMEYIDLLGEASRMKNQLMSHANCNDPNIDRWLDNEAKQFVLKATGRQLQTGPELEELEDPQSALGLSTPQDSIDAAIDPALVLPLTPPESAPLREKSRSRSLGEINYDHMPDSMFEDDSENDCNS